MTGFSKGLVKISSLPCVGLTITTAVPRATVRPNVRVLSAHKEDRTSEGTTRGVCGEKMHQGQYGRGLLRAGVEALYL